MRQPSDKPSPMSNEGRNAYVIEHITDALLKLLRQKPISEISISELCDSAGVGRASFYRNFQNREDIIRAHIGQIFRHDTRALADRENPPLNELLGTIFAHYEKHRDFYSLLNDRNLIFLLKDVIVQICGPKPEHSMPEAYSRAFVAYSLYGWTEVWFLRGMRETAEEITDLFKSQGL